MVAYRKDIERFKERTPLKLFCVVEQKKIFQDDPTPGFSKLIMRFKWPENATLKVIDTFQQAYTKKLGLNKNVMIKSSAESGSFIVTWFVLISLVKTLDCRNDEVF